MALNFPDNPVLNQVFQTWIWNGTAWVPDVTAGGFFPTGTVMLFYQGTAPAGWTQVTTQNDKLLRVVSGSGGVAGGSNPFSTVNAQTGSGNHSLAVAEIPSITSSGTNTITVYGGANTGYYWPWAAGGWNGSGVGSGPYGNYSFTGAGVSYVSYCQWANGITVSTQSTAGTAHNHSIMFSIAYCDLIIASKN